MVCYSQALHSADNFHQISAEKLFNLAHQKFESAIAINGEFHEAVLELGHVIYHQVKWQQLASSTKVAVARGGAKDRVLPPSQSNTALSKSTNLPYRSKNSGGSGNSNTDNN